MDSSNLPSSSSVTSKLGSKLGKDKQTKKSTPQVFKIARQLGEFNEKAIYFWFQYMKERTINLKTLDKERAWHYVLLLFTVHTNLQLFNELGLPVGSYEYTRMLVSSHMKPGNRILAAQVNSMQIDWSCVPRRFRDFESLLDDWRKRLSSKKLLFPKIGVVMNEQEELVVQFTTPEGRTLRSTIKSLILLDLDLRSEMTIKQTYIQDDNDPTLNFVKNMFSIKSWAAWPRQNHRIDDLDRLGRLDALATLLIHKVQVVEGDAAHPFRVGVAEKRHKADCRMMKPNDFDDDDSEDKLFEMIDASMLDLEEINTDLDVIITGNMKIRKRLNNLKMSINNQNSQIELLEMKQLGNQTAAAAAGRIRALQELNTSNEVNMLGKKWMKMEDRQSGLKRRCDVLEK